MKIRRFLRLALIVLTALTTWIGVGGVGGVASAHAEFGQSALPAGIASPITLNVPHEYGGGFFNVRVRIQIPAGWQAVGCSGGPSWSCTTGSVVTFTNSAGAATGQDEEFTLRLLGPAAATGPAYFPIVQTYNATLPGSGHGSANGAEVLWTQSAFLSTYAPGPTSPTTATGPNQSVPSPDSPGSAPVSTQPPGVAEPVLANDTVTPGVTGTSTGTASESEGATTASPHTDPVDESNGSNPPWIVLVLAAIAIVIAVGIVIGIRSRIHR